MRDNSEIKRCVVYARYSSDNQREVSAEEQVRICKEFIASNGYVCVGEYVDKELTGTNANRRQFRKMIDESKKHTFDIVVVYKNDRFSRDRYDKAFYKRKLQNNGVKINYVKEDILNNDSPETIIFEAVSDGMAAYYSANLAREVMEKGHLPNAEKCLHNGGKPPLGLDVVNKHYIVNECEAVVVRKIFNWYANEGYSYKKIAWELNELGFVNKLGKPFKDTSIRDILLNEKYLGTYIYNRRSGKDIEGKRNNSKDKDESEIIRHENAFPAIIDRATFDKVKKVMDSRKGRNACYQAQETYLLSGLIKCGKCGTNMHGNRKPSNRNGSYHVTYKCNKRDKQGTKLCDNKEINKKYIERAVMYYIESLCSGDNFKMIMSALKEYAKSQSDTSEELMLTTKRLNKVEKQISNIVYAISNGFDADELKAQYASLKKQKIDLQGQLAICEAKADERIEIDEDTAFEAFKRMRDSVRNCEADEELKKLFEIFVDRVDVFEGYVTIALNVFYILGFTGKIHSFENEKRPPLDFHQMVVWNGGGDGNRTRVRKLLGKTFYECSLSFTFPCAHADKQAYALSIP